MIFVDLYMAYAMSIYAKDDSTNLVTRKTSWDSSNGKPMVYIMSELPLCSFYLS